MITTVSSPSSCLIGPTRANRLGYRSTRFEPFAR
jgi:hypothetical protein